MKGPTTFFDAPGPNAKGALRLPPAEPVYLWRNAEWALAHHTLPVGQGPPYIAPQQVMERA